jgi:radical SAM superfamily enzyme YgiQ (UPF0313 family)
LGLLYIAGYLENHASQHDIRILDCQVEDTTNEELSAYVKDFQPEVIGITTMTMTILDVIETIKIVKKAMPSVKIILGGPHVHIYPVETIQLEHVDFVVLGEGEKIFTDLIENINDPGRLLKIPGLVYKKNDEIIQTDFPQLIEDLNTLPFPARHLTNYIKYNSLLAPREPTTTLFTSRGCPFQCTFCDRPNLGKKFRARSAINVVDEMEECVELGIHEFIIYDDTFTVQKPRVIEFCNEIIERQLDVGFDFRARVDTITPEMLAKLKQAGCNGIHYGIEAGTEKILEVLNKGISIEEAKRVFKQTREAGIKVLGYFMIGNPSETQDDIKETFRVMKMLNPDYMHLAILTPFPATKIYEMALKQGIYSSDIWREFASNPTSDFVPPIWNEFFSRSELQKLAADGYKRYYLRFSYIIQRIRKLKSWNELIKNIIAGFRVVFYRV